jgi:hypothetical protein
MAFQAATWHGVMSGQPAWIMLAALLEAAILVICWREGSDSAEEEKPVQ